MRRLFLVSMLALAAAAPVMAAAATPAQQDYQQAAASRPDLARGERRFATCGGCHGQDGGGKPDGSIPVIAGQHFRVLVWQLADYRHARRWDARMQTYADTHILADAQAMADVAGYIAALPRPQAAVAQPGPLAARGAALYARHCAACHGPNAEGDGEVGAPRLAGQHEAYLLLQLREAVEGSRPTLATRHLLLLHQLAHDDRAALAQALASMR